MVNIPDFLIFVCCDYLVSTNSYVHVGVCVGNRSHRHDADSGKIGRHNPTCRDAACQGAKRVLSLQDKASTARSAKVFV